MLLSPRARNSRSTTARVGLVMTGLAVAASLALTSCSSDTSTPAAGGHVWTMVTDQAGLGDKGFNDSAHLGIEESVKQLGGTAQVLQSSDQSQFVTNLKQAVARSSTVTTAVGSLLADSVSEVAQDDPQSLFTLIDSDVVSASGAPLPNVAGVTYREQEAAYLAGIVAAMTSTSNRFGFIGGVEVPAVLRYYSGYAAGIKTIKPDATTSITYVGNFTDSAKGKELALGFYSQGVEVLMEAAGAAGIGIFNAAEELGKGHWVVSTDACKEAIAPNNFLTSAVKDVAGTVLRENTAAAKGTFKGGNIKLGIADHAVGLCQDNIQTLSADARKKVDTATAEITSGTLVPPSTPDQLSTFRAPAL